MKKQKGFTIIELIVVVIVIGIIATIGTVVYTGSKKQSINSVVRVSVEQWVKALQLYRVKAGSYPKVPSYDGAQNTSVCLAASDSDLPASGVFEAGACIKFQGSSTMHTTSYQADFIKDIKQVLPGAELPTSTFSPIGTTSRAPYYSLRGISYIDPRQSGSDSISILYPQYDETTCLPGDSNYGSTAAQGGYILCVRVVAN